MAPATSLPGSFNESSTVTEDEQIPDREKPAHIFVIAAVGAAMICWLLVWFYLDFRAKRRDAYSEHIPEEASKSPFGRKIQKFVVDFFYIWVWLFKKIVAGLCTLLSPKAWKNGACTLWTGLCGFVRDYICCLPEKEDAVVYVPKRVDDGATSNGNGNGTTNGKGKQPEMTSLPTTESLPRIDFPPGNRVSGYDWRRKSIRFDLRPSELENNGEGPSTLQPGYKSLLPPPPDSPRQIYRPVSRESRDSHASGDFSLRTSNMPGRLFGRV